MHVKNKINIIIVILSILLLIVLLLLAGTLICRHFAGSQSSTVTIPNNIITSEKENTRPFKVENMFPGDIETECYCVRISHNGDVILRFRAEVLPGYEKLAEVLKCKVVLQDTGEVLYDGLMREMPDSVNYTLVTQTSTVGEVFFEISAYLDTGVGNEYMNRSLIADLHWWIEETGALENSEINRNCSNCKNLCVYLWIFIIIALLLLLILLWKKRRKGGRIDE